MWPDLRKATTSRILSKITYDRHDEPQSMVVNRAEFWSDRVYRYKNTNTISSKLIMYVFEKTGKQLVAMPLEWISVYVRITYKLSCFRVGLQLLARVWKKLSTKSLCARNVYTGPVWTAIYVLLRSWRVWRSVWSLAVKNTTGKPFFYIQRCHKPRWGVVTRWSLWCVCCSLDLLYYTIRQFK